MTQQEVVVSTSISVQAGIQLRPSGTSRILWPATKNFLLMPLHWTATGLHSTAKRLIQHFSNSSIEQSRAPWQSWRTFGTVLRVPATIEENTIIAHAIICSISMQPSPKELLNSDFFNLTARQVNGLEAFTPDSSRATFSFVWHSVRWQRKQKRQALSLNRQRTRNTQ